MKIKVGDLFFNTDNHSEESFCMTVFKVEKVEFDYSTHEFNYTGKVIRPADLKHIGTERYTQKELLKLKQIKE